MPQESRPQTALTLKHIGFGGEPSLAPPWGSAER